MPSDKEQYNELIRWFIPINLFSAEYQDEVVRMADILTFRKKDFIFRQGEQDDSSYYILKGEIELLSNKRVEKTIKSGTDRARYPVAQLQPHHYSARAKTEVTILKLDRLALDRLMVLDAKRISDKLYGGDVREIRDMEEEESGDWMTSMLQSSLFCRLPTENIYQLFTLLKPMHVNAGDTIIKQGEVADFYFFIREGSCEITRTPSSGSKPIKLTELQSGDSFGEEALLTHAKHNVSVTMLTDGVLMKLSKENFINLIERPVINAVSYPEARKLVATGAQWLDVRYQNEHETSSMEGSINIPLNILRMEAGKLQPDESYVIYCDTGVRSSAAAFLLTKRGYNVYYLEKGLKSLPQSGVLQEDATSDETQGVEENQAAEKEAVLDRLDGEEWTLEKADETTDIMTWELQRQDTEKIRKLKEEADRRLEDEKKKIEEIYERNAREMEKLRQLKREAEEQLNKEREELLKQFEKSRLALESEAEKKRTEQEAMEKAMQNKIKAMLEKERLKLAEEVVRVNREMKQTRREEAIANAARKAINKEAKIILEEFRKEYEQERAAEQARLNEEHRNLELVSKKIQETLKEIQNTRQKAEAIWRSAETDAEKLREKQLRLEAEIKSAEIKLTRARKHVVEVQETEESVALVQEVKEVELLKQKEEELRKKVEADIGFWKEEHADDLIVPESVLVDLKHMKEYAEEAKRAAEKRARDLISEIAAQIWKR